MEDWCEFAYLRGALSAEQLRDEIAKFWIEMKSESGLQARLDSLGLSSGTLDGIETADAITVHVGSSGVDPASVVLIVALAPTANRVLKDVWTAAILPRIRRRWGDDAVGQEVSRHGR